MEPGSEERLSVFEDFFEKLDIDDSEEDSEYDDDLYSYCQKVLEKFYKEIKKNGVKVKIVLHFH